MSQVISIEQQGSVLPFPINEELVEYMSYPQQILFYANFIRGDLLNTFLNQNLHRLSLYDLRILKAAGIREAVDNEVRRRLNTNIYDGLRPYIDFETPIVRGVRKWEDQR